MTTATGNNGKKRTFQSKLLYFRGRFLVRGGAGARKLEQARDWRSSSSGSIASQLIAALDAG